MEPKPTVLCDFDGTISIGDVGEMLIERFLGDRWQTLDDAYHKGTYGMVELYRRSFEEIEAGESAFAEFIDSKRIDPDFSGFLAACARSNIQVNIVSDGFDYYITRLLERDGARPVPIFSNHMRFVDGHRELVFPNEHETCRECANCKKKIVDEFAAAGPVIYIGNGLSDCCAAEGAHLVYAKDSLAEHFTRAKLAFETYNSFFDILNDFCERGFLPNEPSATSRTTEKRS